ncbi:MAG: CRISPR-associated endonuclease Cas1 [Casimicrobiaceae bacterium]|nr:CRISPR-associated endonuclease Cas1 [Casimicrobiaceae bacterium]
MLHIVFALLRAGQLQSLGEGFGEDPVNRPWATFSSPWIGSEHRLPPPEAEVRVGGWLGGLTVAQAHTWIERIAAGLAEHPHGNYTLESFAFGEPTTVEALAAVPQALAEADEVELRWRTPWRVEPKRGMHYRPPDARALLGAFFKRIEGLFGVDLSAERAQLSTLELVHAVGGMRWLVLKHEAKSSPGTQVDCGWVGRSFLSGADLAAVLPWLRLAEALHFNGRRTLNGFGAASLHISARPLFDPVFCDPEAIAEALGRLTPLDADGRVRDEALPDPRSLAAALRNGEYRAQPSRAWNIPKRGGTGGETRPIEALHPADRIVADRLRAVLEPWVERYAGPHVHGYRLGHSVQTALLDAADAVADGLHWAIKTDIHDFFPSISHDLLQRRLSEIVPRADRSFWHALREQLTIAPEASAPRERGLVQGSPLSPVLSNLYLDHIDHLAQGQHARLIRYADDLLILARTREHALDLLDQLRAALARCGLAPAADKLRFLHLSEGVRVLGHEIKLDPSGLLAWPPRLPPRRPLIVSSPNRFIGCQGNAVYIRHGEAREIVVPLGRLSALIVLARRHAFSGELIERLAHAGIPIVLGAETSRRPNALAELGKRPLERLHRHAAWHGARREEDHLAIARQLIHAKLANQSELIARSRQRGASRVARLLIQLATRAATAADRDALRGHEGSGARLYFAHLGERLAAAGWDWRGRQPQQADPVNALFDFLYHLLRVRTHALLVAQGLNPFLGHLHSAQNDYDSLTYDLLEPFRAPIDRVALNLLLPRRLGPSDFTAVGDRLRLAHAARLTVIAEFERLLREPLGELTLADHLELQVANYARHVFHGRTLALFEWKRAREAVAPPAQARALARLPEDPEP